MSAQTQSSLSRMVQRKAYRIVFLQLIGIIIFACLALFINGISSGFSILVGGLAYGLLNLVFVWFVFRYAGAQQMTLFVAAFFAGEALKLILSGILVLLIVKYLPVSLLSVLIGLIGAIVLFWVACLIRTFDMSI